MINNNNNFNNPMEMLMSTINGNVNPQQIIGNIISQNPQAQIIFNQMKNSGMNVKDYVLQYAKQSNININPLLTIFSNRGIKL